MQVFEFHFNPKAKEDVIYEVKRRSVELYLSQHDEEIQGAIAKMSSAVGSKVKKELSL